MHCRFSLSFTSGAMDIGTFKAVVDTELANCSVCLSTFFQRLMVKFARNLTHKILKTDICKFDL